MRLLYFKSHYRIERLPPDLVFLLSERDTHTLAGRLYYLLAPLLDGTRDEDSIIAALRDDALPMQIGYALDRLRRQGYVIEHDVTVLPGTEQNRFWSSYGEQPSGRIAITSVGDLDLTPVIEMLTAMKLYADPDQADLLLVFTDSLLDERLRHINSAPSRAWMPVTGAGTWVSIGPIFEPLTTPCWECLEYRVRANRPVLTFLEDQFEYPLDLPIVALPSTRLTAASIAATQAALWLSGSRRMRDHLYTFDTWTNYGEWHRLIPRPNCAVCGQPHTRTAEPLHLHSRQKITDVDAGYRSAAAAETLNRYGHHVSRVTGIVSHLTRVRTPDHMHVYASGHNKARPLNNWGNFKRHLRSQSAGKGIDDVQARASALCEALERYSGLHQGDEPRITARWGELDGTIHPTDLLQYSDAQYANREQWNQTCPPHLIVPDPYDETCPVDWSPVWSLTENRFKYVPSAYCYYDYPTPPDHLFCGVDSNGCAAGSSLEDAILQGFLELVERDAIALWWYNRITRPVWEIDGIDSAYLQRTRAYLAQNRRDLWVLDLTSDFDIPAAVAISRRADGDTEDIVLGFGAHLDPQIAILRAVSEMNQSLPAAMRDANGAYQSDSAWEIDWWKYVKVDAHSFLKPDVTLPRSLPEMRFPQTDDLRGDIEACVTLARQRGIEVLVLDQTRADSGLSVVRVIAPGLRHFWSRFAPGRLYDVPVQMGWLAAPLSESELNPLPMFM